MLAWSQLLREGIVRCLNEFVLYFRFVNNIFVPKRFYSLLLESCLFNFFLPHQSHRNSFLTSFLQILISTELTLQNYCPILCLFRSWGSRCSTARFALSRIRSHRQLFCLKVVRIVATSSWACQQSSTRRASLAQRLDTARLRTLTRCRDYMAPSLHSRRLTCFYCGRRSPLQQDGSVTEWRCGNCEAVNYLDEVSWRRSVKQLF